MASAKTISRLSLYRRILLRQWKDRAFVFSHELATEAGATSAQVRRDLMVIGYSGSPNRGYEVGALLESIGEHLDSPKRQAVALVGLGNLGRAILSFATNQCASLEIVAAFDTDPLKTGRVIQGCRCHAENELEQIVRDEAITVGILAVPALAAQGLAERLVSAGVSGLLNFAPVRLRVNPGTYVENIDLTVALEKVAWFAGRGHRNGSGLEMLHNRRKA